ncbi:MAG: DUF3090 family protein [Actinomycetota bacterium]
MNESFEFREVTHFTAGAVGQPGSRTFFLQVGDGLSMVTVKLEKQQVRALAQFLKGVMDDMPATPAPAGATPLIAPTDPAWTVGQIAVGVDEADAEVVLVIEELIPMDEDADELDIADDIRELEEGTGAKIRAHIGVAHAAGFIATSDELMEGGRPPCRLCGQPLDPSGHACPRLN